MGYQIWIIWNDMQKANELPVLGTAPDFTMTNLEGEKVTFSDMNGEIRLVFFFFARCDDYCPLITKKMIGIQNLLKEKGLLDKEVQIVGITVDPEGDTPNVLNFFMKQYDIDPNDWTLLRPDNKSHVEEIAWKFGGILKDFDHSTEIILVDQKGKARQKYSGAILQTEDEVILNGIMKLIKEE
jgi:protein SCO1/2